MVAMEDIGGKHRLDYATFEDDKFEETIGILIYCNVPFEAEYRGCFGSRIYIRNEDWERITQGIMIGMAGIFIEYISKMVLEGI